MRRIPPLLFSSEVPPLCAKIITQLCILRKCEIGSQASLKNVSVLPFPLLLKTQARKLQANLQSRNGAEGPGHLVTRVLNARLSPLLLLLRLFSMITMLSLTLSMRRSVKVNDGGIKDKTTSLKSKRIQVLAPNPPFPSPPTSNAIGKRICSCRVRM